ncbi:MAG: dihydropteroate synthase [Cyanobacteria bacterium P01_H01_bin.74]
MRFPTSTQLMAILNITPDSFSDGGKLLNRVDIMRSAEHALMCGASILDVGGESTRPGAISISEEEEMARVLPTVKLLHEEFPEAVISIDTRKAAVAHAAVEAGASMINDVSGLTYDGDLMLRVATVAQKNQAAQKKQSIKLVITHSQGTPDQMQDNPEYPDGVVETVTQFFEKQIDRICTAGFKRENIIIDPGFGFGKTIAHNLTLLGALAVFKKFELPVMAGLSRKSFLTLGNRDILPQEREALTAAAITIALQNGADIIRLHDVEAQMPVVRLTESLLNAAKVQVH